MLFRSTSGDASLVTDDELMLLGGATGVPLLRILNLSALSRYQGIAHDLTRIYVEAAAYEMLASAVRALAQDIRTTLTSSAASSTSSEHVRHVERLEQRIAQIEASLHARESKVMQAMMRASSLVVQLEHIERSLAGNQSAALLQVLQSEQRLCLAWERQSAVLLVVLYSVLQGPTAVMHLADGLLTLLQWSDVNVMETG